jgi:hypothetical protein
VTRPLRPAHLQLVAGELWAIDAIQPVAAVLDPVSGEFRRLVSWPEVPPWHTASEYEWRTLSAGDALWVQSGYGPPARVTPDGEVVAATVRTESAPASWRLAAAGPGGAWLMGYPPLDDDAAAPDTPPPGGGLTRLLAVSPEGDVREVVVEHAVHDVVGTGQGALIAVDTGRGRRVNIGHGTRPFWRWRPEIEWLLVHWNEGAPPVVSTGTHRTVATPRLPSTAVNGRRFMWHGRDREYGRPTEAERADVAGGLRWELGWDLPGGRPPPCVASGHDLADGTERLRVSLGHGTVLAALGTPDRLFVALGEPGAASALLAVDPVSGEITEVLAADALDVAKHCRVLGPPPADLRSYANYWLRYWAVGDGLVEPLVENMTNARAELVGDWPSTRIEVTFDWASYPGIRLRRRLPLFDELGRHTPPELSRLHLAEDLVSGGPPAASAQVGGVLDV